MATATSGLEKTDRLGYNMKMRVEKYAFSLPRGQNPHDCLGRKTIGDPLIAADLLRHFSSSPDVVKHVDLDNLQPEPTHFFGPTHPVLGPQEVILDVPYIAHLRDKDWKSDVLLVYEHKSSPNLFVPLQLGVQALLSLYKSWLDAGRPSSRKKFRLPMPLMVLVYCGAKDLDEKLLFFQEIFEFVPELFKQLVPQFGLLTCNLRRFGCDKLPGRPETQAIVETMNRSFDGTLGKHFREMVTRRFNAVSIDDRITDIINTITWFSGCVANIAPEQITETITTTFKGEKGIQMAELIQKGIFQQGVERGKLEEKINDIMKVLRVRVKQVPDSIVDELNERTDLIALDSLLEVAAQCNSIEEFADALK